MTRRCAALLLPVLLLGLALSACGPRKHLHPKSGRYYRTAFQAQIRAVDGAQPLPALGAEEGAAIHKRYVRGFRGKGADADAAAAGGGAVGGLGGGMFTGGGAGGGLGGGMSATDE